MYKILLRLFFILFAPDFPDILLNVASWRKDLATAAKTADFEIHTDTQHKEFLRAAGVRLLHFENILFTHVQNHSPHMAYCQIIHISNCSIITQTQ